MFCGSPRGIFRGVRFQWREFPMPHYFKFAVLFLLVLLCRADSADIVRFSSEEGTRSHVGTITEISATEVKIVRANSNTPIVVPAFAISATQYNQEPPALGVMRTALAGSRYSAVLEAAQKLDPATIANPFARQDYEFFRAFALGQMALEVPGNAENLQKAITASVDFLRTQSRSYHYFPICELAGELHLAAGNRENAFQMYSRLAQAPWPAFPLRANTKLGTIRLEENRLEEAEKFYKSALASEDSPEDSQRTKTEAEIGLAKCLIRKGDLQSLQTAIERLDTLSMKIDSENARLQAAIYLALGEAYEAAENPKEAILAYLHIEILFPSAKTEYVSALKRLTILWGKVNRPERAAEAERNLAQMKNNK